MSYTVSVHNQPSSLFLGFSIELSLLPSYKVAMGTHGGPLQKNMIFSVTYYLELHNAMIVYCASHLFTNHGWIGCLHIIEH